MTIAYSDPTAMHSSTVCGEVLYKLVSERPRLYRVSKSSPIFTRKHTPPPARYFSLMAQAEAQVTYRMYEVAEAPEWLAQQSQPLFLLPTADSYQQFLPSRPCALLQCEVVRGFEGSVARLYNSQCFLLLPFAERRSYYSNTRFAMAVRVIGVVAHFNHPAREKR